MLPLMNVLDLSQLKAALEAIIFVADDPIPLSRLKEIFPEESYDKLQSAINELSAEFNQNRPGIEIREIAGGYCMRTKPEHHEWVRAYLKTRPGARLSLPALETLAVIAYRQPITIAEIMAIRGVKSSSAIKTLLEKKLIDACGRKKVLGRPILYGTTKQFLMHFGLKDIKDLPSMEEFEEFLKQEMQPQENPLVPEQDLLLTQSIENDLISDAEPQAVPAGEEQKEDNAAAQAETAMSIQAEDNSSLLPDEDMDGREKATAAEDTPIDSDQGLSQESNQPPDEGEDV